MKRHWLVSLRGVRSQHDVANECGVSQNFYCWIETGERTPSVDNAKKIAQVLGFDWTKFYEEGSK